MATAAQRQQAEAAKAIAAGAAGAAAGQAIGDLAAAQSVKTGAVSAQGLANAVSKILMGFVQFLAALSDRTESYLRAVLVRRITDQARVNRLIAEEMEREREFDRKAAERMQRELPVVLAIPQRLTREQALRVLMNRERRYADARATMVAHRLEAGLHRSDLRELSPQGAYWQLSDRPIEHCPICLSMAGKFWPWAVIDRLHPPVHMHCGCDLLSRGQAIALGLLDPGYLPDAKAAERAALAVVASHDEERPPPEAVTESSECPSE